MPKKTSYQDHLQEIEILYDELSFHLNHFDEKRNGISNSNFEKYDFAYEKKIEEFIAYLITTKSPLCKLIIEEATNLSKLIPRPKAREFSPYDFILKNSLENNVPHINPIIQTFNKLAKEIISISISEHYKYGRLPRLENYNCSLEHLNFQDFNVIQTMTEFIRKHYQDKSNKPLITNRTKSTNRSYKNYCTYLDSLFKDHESLSFICLEFTLPTTIEGKSIHDFKTDFFNKGRSTTALSDLVGYFGKWEFSLPKGSYFRVVFIFPTEDVINVKALNDLIADYWTEEITQGSGECHFSNLAAKTPKLKRQSCIIKKSEAQLIKSFKERVVAYITLSEKYFMPPQLVNLLNFGKSDNTRSRNAHNTIFSGNLKKLVRTL